MRPWLFIIACFGILGASLEARAELPADPGLSKPEIRSDCGLAKRLGGTRAEREVICEVGERHYKSARSLAEAILRQDPQSARAHWGLGSVQYEGEGNLPKAIYHLNKALKLVATQSKAEPLLREDTLFLKVLALSEMDRDAEAIAEIDRIQAEYGTDYSYLKAWHLMKLRRFGEAREVAMAGLSGSSIEGRNSSANSLCAIESELQNRLSAYQICTSNVRTLWARRTHKGGVTLSNAGLSALGMLKFQEAESFWLRAGHHLPDATSNPWVDLTALYLRMGRYSEIPATFHKMLSAHAAMVPHFRQQTSSELLTMALELLWVSGDLKAAADLAEAISRQPDRTGMSSNVHDQEEGSSALLSWAVKLDWARALEDEAGLHGFWGGLKLRLKAAWVRSQAAASRRRLMRVLASENRFMSSLRPDATGGIELPLWLGIEIVRAAGPGVALAMNEKAESEDDLPHELSLGYFTMSDAEAQLLLGHPEIAAEHVNLALSVLPPAEAQLIARAQAIQAKIAQMRGQSERETFAIEAFLPINPGLLRRFDIKLGVQIQTDGDPLSDEVREKLLQSRRFKAEHGAFRIQIHRGGADLLGPSGTRISRVLPMKEPAKDAPPHSAEAVAIHILSGLFKTDLGLSDVDIRRLSGRRQSHPARQREIQELQDQIIDPGPPVPTR